MYNSTELMLGSIVVVMALFSTVCSLLTLYLIHKIAKKWNGYLVLIYSMTCCQVFYDSSFFCFVFYKVPSVYRYIQFATAWGGLSVTMWTNVLSGIVVYIVFFHCSLDIWKHYGTFFALCMLPSLAFSLAELFCDDPYFFNSSYNIARLVSVMLNVIAYLAVSRRLQVMMSEDSVATGPLKELSSRLKFYPICQVVTRIPACYYQFQYGLDTSAFSSQRNLSQSIALGFYATFTPAAGIGYFVVFLFMQPQAMHQLFKAWRRLKKYVFRSLRCHLPLSANRANTGMDGTGDGDGDGSGGGSGAAGLKSPGQSDDDDSGSDVDGGKQNRMFRMSSSSSLPPLQVGLLTGGNSNNSSNLSSGAGSGAGAGAGAGISVKDMETGRIRSNVSRPSNEGERGGGGGGGRRREEAPTSDSSSDLWRCYGEMDEDELGRSIDAAYFTGPTHATASVYSYE